MFRSISVLSLALAAMLTLQAAEAPVASAAPESTPAAPAAPEAPATPESTEAPAKVESGKPRIAVYDFTTIDIQGQHLQYFTDQQIKVRPYDSLTDADRETVDEVMLGFVKMIDAKELSATHRDARLRGDRENDRNYVLQRQLADKLLKTHIRPVVIGAQYMEAALGECKNVEAVDRGTIEKAFADMGKLQSGEFPGTALAGIAGASHILYATVADLRVQERIFKGYGVETKAVIYSLDLLVKIVDAKTRQVVFSRMFTAQNREMHTPHLKQIDTDRFGSLMKQAVFQAAQEIDRRFENNSQEK